MRALAHHLNPVVQVGNAGLTEGVQRQIDGALEAHELIKVKLGKDCPVDPSTEAAQLCTALHGHLVTATAGAL